MIKIHREGRWIVALTIIFLLVLVFVAGKYLPVQANYVISVFALLLLILVLRFFRVPRRRPFLDDRSITAPSDGKVVVIEKVHSEEFLNGPAIQLSIFMSIHDVHINYFPVEGKVVYTKYHPGRYLVARHPKSSSLNERASTGIETSGGKILVRQVAGYVARRIKCYARTGEASRQGKEMGFIKFGSRLDLFLPPETDIKVSLSQKVIGGVTTVARFK
jgi:phosphatidylserine decarboxylase